MTLMTDRMPIDWPSSWGAPPSWATRRNRARATHGPAIAGISQLLRKPFFPWQRYVVDVASEVDPKTGGPWYETVIVLVQRRSGKTVQIPAIAARECGQKDPRQVWLTAQKRDNAVKRWKDATQPLLPLVPAARRKISHSFEEMAWPSGSKFVPFAPDEDSMHGEDPDLVFVDEFWSLGLAQYQTIREGYSAAWSVKPGQEWLLSAAGTHASTALKDARRRGRAAVEDPSSRIAYFEWCIPDQVGGTPVAKLCDDELLRLIMAHHPRAGHGLRPDFVAGEIVKNRTGAIRAYGGLDSDTSEEESVIDGDSIRRSLRRDRSISRMAKVAFGLGLDSDLRQAAISVAWQDPADGVILTELIEARDQVRWSTSSAVALLGRWPGSVLAVRSDAGGRDLADDLRVEMAEAGIDPSRLVLVSQSDYAAACHRLRSGMESTPPRVLHHGERELRRAMQAADLRRGVWVPARGPVAVLDSHSLAGWAATRIPAEPEPARPFRVL